MIATGTCAVPLKSHWEKEDDCTMSDSYSLQIVLKLLCYNLDQLVIKLPLDILLSHGSSSSSSVRTKCSFFIKSGVKKCEELAALND